MVLLSLVAVAQLHSTTPHQRRGATFVGLWGFVGLVGRAAGSDARDGCWALRNPRASIRQRPAYQWRPGTPSDGSTSPARQLPAPAAGRCGSAAEGRAGVSLPGKSTTTCFRRCVSHRFDHRPAGWRGWMPSWRCGVGLAVDDPGQPGCRARSDRGGGRPRCAVRQVRERARDQRCRSEFRGRHGRGNAQLYATGRLPLMRG